MAALLTVALAGWLYACLQGWVVPARRGSGGVRVGFVLATMQEERYQKDYAAFTGKAAALGVRVEFNDARNDGQIQVQVVQDILTRGVDVMVIQPVNSETASNLVELCHRKGVPVIAYDRVIMNCDLDLYVTQDPYRVGVLQAEAAVQATGGKGRYVLLKGTQGHSVAEEITRGIKETLARYPDVQIVAEQYHPNWAPNEALTTMENVLTREGGKIDAVLCNNSGMARGAVQALRRAGLAGKVFLAGADADLDNVRMVLDGEQSIEVLKPVKPLAEASVEAAHKLAQGLPAAEVARQLNGGQEFTCFNGKVQVPTINTEVVLVTRENVEETVIGSGFHPREKLQDLLGPR